MMLGVFIGLDLSKVGEYAIESLNHDLLLSFGSAFGPASVGIYLIFRSQKHQDQTTRKQNN